MKHYIMCRLRKTDIDRTLQQAIATCRTGPVRLCRERATSSSPAYRLCVPYILPSWNHMLRALSAIVEGLSNEVLQSQIANCIKRLRNEDDETIKKEVSDLLLKKESRRNKTTLGNIRKINWKYTCIIVTLFVLSKLSGITFYNTYIGNVFISKRCCPI